MPRWEGLASSARPGNRNRIQFMKPNQDARKCDSFLRRTVELAFLAGAAGLLALQRSDAATNVVVWDTGSRLTDPTGAENRAGWKSVPSDLFVFEAEPLKAASDPGYYGREYSFKGDAVVENRSLAAVFWSAKGRVVLYAKGDVDPTGGTSAGNTG